MKIIIVGCGKVGSVLAEQLNDEGHEISVIDRNEEKLEDISSQIDIIGIVGNGTSYRILSEADVQHTDLLIAVTNRDEVNLLSCLIAKKAGNCQTIARVRDPEYYEEINFIREELGLTMAINPELAAAMEMLKLIHLPSALEIDTFEKGRVNLVRTQIPSGSILDGLPISEIPSKLDKNILICIVERHHEVIIPDGNFVIQADDIVSIVIPLNWNSDIFNKIGYHSHSIKNVMLAGGGTISYYLARMLLKSKVNVTIIEKDLVRCEELSELLPRATIIHGDATDRKLLIKEGLLTTDAFVTLTGLDEENILLALYASRLKDFKLITKINRFSFEEIVMDMPVGSIVCPKYITAENIIHYVRSMHNSYGCNMDALYRMIDNKVEALGFTVPEESHIINISLTKLTLKSNLLICSINRNGNIMIPSGKDVLLPGDKVIVVTTHKGLQNIDDIIK